MAAMNYFTCTLGEAKNLDRPSEFDTVNTLLELQATRRPDLPAVAFPRLDDCSYQIFTFCQLYEGSLNSAGRLSIGGEPGCVALLCASSVDFLFAWLGLIRTGSSILLIAPQCSPSAIVALCKSCNASRLYHDKANAGLASSAANEEDSCFQAFQIPWEEAGISSLFEAKGDSNSMNWPKLSSRDVAYIHHSSGTSSGIPKPIPQTNHGAVAVLPTLDGQNAGTFTTTPLYHGGIADCLRSWTSNALIWLFPGADAPITSATILSSLSITAKVTPLVQYFSSVPFVLQMLAETSEGLQALKQMNIVGVGGAALPEAIGDRLVKENVNLISRFGSAECGFLLSSHRDYLSDKDWQYLRDTNCGHVVFEVAESGLAELIVPPDWPHMAKRNRDDGSYATSDLFEPHATIKNAWKYHSRSDSQITLLTGKKFDPAPIEDDIKTTSALIDDIFIFGNGRQMPGAVVLTANADHERDALKRGVWEDLQQVNAKQQPHARISQNMFDIICKPYPPLERSSKGTLLRSQAEHRYRSYIEKMYEHIGGRETTCQSWPIERVESTVRKTIVEVIGEDLGDDADFFHSGIDSTKASQIRSRLQREFGHDNLPWNIVYDCQNMRGLVRYFSEDSISVTCEPGSQSNNMIRLAEQYSKFDFTQAIQYSKLEQSEANIVLTGATGGLGAHILTALQHKHSVDRIICLVRAADNIQARARVSKSLTERRLPPLPESIEDRIFCVPVQLGQPDLGLSIEIISKLRETTTHIIHAAWAVNFSLPLQSFAREHLAGLHNLIDLAASCRNFRHFTFCSSTASVIGQGTSQNSGPILEKIYDEPPPDNSLGYSKSKWVAETICKKASAHPRLASKISVVRIGQLTGDTKNGVWNRSEAWPLMLSTANQLGCLPKVHEKSSWLPVDVAAEAVIDISFSAAPARPDNTCTVYHVVNNNRSTSWLDLLSWINELTDKVVEVVEPQEWLDRLQITDHPARSLLGLWWDSLGNKTSLQDDRGKSKSDFVFDTTNAEQASESMRAVGPVDEILVGKIWQWLIIEK